MLFVVVVFNLEHFRFTAQLNRKYGGKKAIGLEKRKWLISVWSRRKCLTVEVVFEPRDGSCELRSGPARTGTSTDISESSDRTVQ